MGQGTFCWALCRSGGSGRNSTRENTVVYVSALSKF